MWSLSIRCVEGIWSTIGLATSRLAPKPRRSHDVNYCPLVRMRSRQPLRCEGVRFSIFRHSIRRRCQNDQNECPSNATGSCCRRQVCRLLMKQSDKFVIDIRPRQVLLDEVQRSLPGPCCSGRWLGIGFFSPNMMPVVKSWLLATHLATMLTCGFEGESA
jgi:hypothetical protein